MLFAAVIIGGAGNHLGAILGAVLVPVGFEEVTRYIPTSNNLPPNLIPSLEWVAIGLLIVIFLWVRPQGILPERKRVIRAGAAAIPPTAAAPRRRARRRRAGPVGGRACRAAGRLCQQGLCQRCAPPSSAPGRPRGRARGRRRVPRVRRRPGGRRRLVHGPARHADRADRPERGGQVDAAGHAGRDAARLRAGRSATRARTSPHLPAYRRARLGLVRTFQLASEFKRLTVMENLLSAVPDNRGDSFRGALAGPQVLARRRGRGDRQGRGAARAVRPRRRTPTATPGTSAAASAGWWRSCAR